jgi:hypothetical protein
MVSMYLQEAGGRGIKKTIKVKIQGGGGQLWPGAVYKVTTLADPVI